MMKEVGIPSDSSFLTEAEFSHTDRWIKRGGIGSGSPDKAERPEGPAYQACPRGPAISAAVDRWEANLSTDC